MKSWRKFSERDEMQEWFETTDVHCEIDEEYYSKFLNIE